MEDRTLRDIVELMEIVSPKPPSCVVTIGIVSVLCLYIIGLKTFLIVQSLVLLEKNVNRSVAATATGPYFAPNT